ncbi:MAG: hypothetical protein EP338_03655 [Bacteroidetes bacterium]|nr:MAG: hypothetical protein EP338_03655 [Bacteroidota bacterium]
MNNFGSTRLFRDMYITLHEIKDVLASIEIEYSASGCRQLLERWEEFQSRIESHADRERAGSFKSRIESLSEESVWVFSQWIEAHPALTGTIQNKSFDANDFRESYLKHQLFEAFQRYVSPYLREVLRTKITTEEEVVRLGTYLNLLTETDRLIVQRGIKSFLEQEWEQASVHVKAAQTEEELIQELRKLYSERRMAVLNAMDKQMYLEKRLWIDRGIDLINHPAMSYRLAYWLVKQLNHLKLNPEHQQQLAEVEKSLRQGDGRFMKRRSLLDGQKNKWNWRRMVAVLLLIFVGTGVYYFRNLFQSKEKEVELAGSSFEQFTLGERKHLDSLIREMDPQVQERSRYKQDNANHLHLNRVSIPIVSKRAYRNQQIQKYLDACELVISWEEQGKIDSCRSYRQSELPTLKIPGFEALEKSMSGTPFYIRNATEEQVLILLFEDRPGGKVYHRFLRPAEECRFLAGRGKEMIFLSGNDLGSIELRESQRKQLGKSYRHHFCLREDSFSRQMSRSYQVRRDVSSEAKVLLNRSVDGEFYLVDLEELLEEKEAK